MIQQKHFAGGLLALGISIALQTGVSAATDTPSNSWLMSDAEVAAHTAAMARLEGPARDEYRNAQYEQLKRRAQEHGFELPADPPWANEIRECSRYTAAEMPRQQRQPVTPRCGRSCRRVVRPCSRHPRPTSSVCRKRPMRSNNRSTPNYRQIGSA